MSKTKSGGDRVYLQNAAKTLATNIRFASVDNPVHTIVITSSVPNEGKSTIAIELSKAMASGSKCVLLVECDMRRRSLASMVGVHARQGIYAVLSGQVSLEEAAVETSHRGLFFLDSEPHIPNPVDILSSRRFGNFIQNAREAFDYVIVDTPPLSAFVDASVISTVVDGTLLVVRQNFVKRDELVAAYQQLEKAKAHVIGAVMNYCDTEKSEYYYSYYTKGGKKAPTVSFDAPPSTASTSARALAQAPKATPAPKPVARPQQASRPAAAQSQPAASQGGAVPGLKPIPQGGVRTSSDSTAQFLAGTGYASRTYTDE